MAQENCCNLEDFIKVGPWGSQGGTPWSFKPKGLISEIIIRHGWLIDSISFKSEDGTDNTIEYSNKFGGDGGKTDKISLDTPREYLISITGTHDAFNYIIQSLYFYTNRTKYGPFGSSKLGTSFNLPMEGGVIVGFHGRSGALLDAIGVYVKCAADVLPLSYSRRGQMATNKEVNNVVMNVDASREAGPWGGNKGKSWDDGVFSGVEQVNVHVGNGIVHAVQFFYGSKDGKSVWSKMHGTGDGGSLNRIKLDCSSEYLVGMMGFYGPIEENSGFETIRSVSFYTNKGKYGPFGTEIGTAFGSPASDGKIVGFHGKSGAYLDAIGVHVEYF